MVNLFALVLSMAIVGGIGQYLNYKFHYMDRFWMLLKIKTSVWKVFLVLIFCVILSGIGGWICEVIGAPPFVYELVRGAVIGGAVMPTFGGTSEINNKV